MRASNRPVRRGFTLIELLVVVLVCAALFWLLWRVNGTTCGVSPQVRCMTRVRQICVGVALYSDDSGGSYPIPMGISPETAALSKQSGNSSANLFSYLIFNTYCSPDAITCPSDANPNLVVKTNYRYGTPDDEGWNTAWKWDPSLSADITQWGANASYATLAMIGDRRTNHWKYLNDPNFAVAGDRGPKDGVWNAKSLTLQNHGNRDAWKGSVAMNDGSVQVSVFGAKDSPSFAINGDNLFFADDGSMGGDMWLGLFGATDETTTTPYWD
ncbi:MAG: prepilin-type N-terminal cleavage/methylation domain-containing protein [Phycisphaerales bacterium]|nr:prepilin-type N-terminal cleavage/methylation domain-containing protein [Phycisphaerales bacterium]